MPTPSHTFFYENSEFKPWYFPGQSVLLLMSYYKALFPGE